MSVRPWLVDRSRKIAKRLLTRADTLESRSEAVHHALGLGMPLWEIEEYLDWLQFVETRAGSPSKEQR